jgi:hypothetical protein
VVPNLTLRVFTTDPSHPRPSARPPGANQEPLASALLAVVPNHPSPTRHDMFAQIAVVTQYRVTQPCTRSRCQGPVEGLVFLGPSRYVKGFAQWTHPRGTGVFRGSRLPAGDTDVGRLLPSAMSQGV